MTNVPVRLRIGFSIRAATIVPNSWKMCFSWITFDCDQHLALDHLDVAHPTSIVRGSLRAPASYTRHCRRDRCLYGRDLRRSDAQDLHRPARTTTATSARLLRGSANREVLSRKSGGDGRGVHVRGWLLPPQPRRSGRRVIRTCLLPVALLADALQARGFGRIPPERLTRKRPVAGRAVAPRIRLDPPARDPTAGITPHPHRISLAREGFGTARYRAGARLKNAGFVCVCVAAENDVWRDRLEPDP